jgi:ABC-type polysaccharide/polyol phosphate transport system ATPase subunit
MAAIRFDHVSKSFHSGADRRLLRTHLAEWLGRKSGSGERFHALRDVSFEVAHGESVAVIGSNGAGKSTLLSLVSGITEPDGGSMMVGGHVAALLELGSGFHQDLTGEENLWINASLMGLSRRETGRLHDRIVEFSGIGPFIGEPLRTYSSGMIMRLAFSIAIHVDPDVLLIDEVFAVGDQEFQARCLDRMLAFRRAGKTMLSVSHAPEMLGRMCDRGLWLDHGRLRMEGPIDEVLAAYESSLELPAGAGG